MRQELDDNSSSMCRLMLVTTAACACRMLLRSGRQPLQQLQLPDGASDGNARRACCRATGGSGTR